jgi:two-component system, cell cycle sensor histidine kinase and response regulator CckA
VTARRTPLSVIGGPVIVAGAAAVLVGWWLHVPALTTMVHGWPSMKPNTAAAFVLVGVSLFAVQRDAQLGNAKWRAVGIACAALAAGLGLITIIEYRAGLDLGIDRAIMQHALAPGETGPAGRMAEATAWGFLLAGSAVVLFAFHVATAVGQALLVVVGLLATVPALGYAYADSAMRAIGPFASVAELTAVLFLVLVVAALHVRPDEGPMRTATGQSLGGRMIRRLVPIFAVVIYGGGLLRTWGLRTGVYTPGSIEPILVVTVMATLTAALWYNAVLLGRIEAERDRFFTLSRDMFCILGVNGRLTRVNQAFTRSLGWSTPELVEHSLPEFVHPDDRAGLAEALDRLATTDAGHEFECRVRTRTGAWRLVSWTAAVGPGRRLAYVAGRDVTDLHATQEALRASQENLAVTLRSIGDGVIVTDFAGVVTTLNPAGERLTGWTESEARGRPVAEVFHIVRADTREPAAVPVDGVLRTGRDTTMVNRTVLIARDGAEHPIGDSAAPIRDGAGRLIGAVMVFRDVTAERALEDSLRESNAELQAQFLQAQKMESVGRLAGSVAHDFNNLLTVINNVAELAAVDVREDSPLAADLKTIRETGWRAAELTRQLLAFSRRQVLQPRMVNLNQTIGDMVPMLGRLLGESVTLEFSPGAGLWNTRVDPGQFEQIVMNLVVNARDAMSAGGRLAIETRNVDLDDTYPASRADLERGEFVMVAVTDTGTGMDAQTASRIFEPFYTTKPVGQGTGLGLSTVYGIAKQSGGDVLVYSEVGVGTTFKVYLPRMLADEEAKAAARAPQASRGTETVLVVEDEAVLRALSTRVLTQAGYTVLAAADGTEALAILEQHRGDIDLVLTDLVMPGMGGRELATRAAARHADVRVLFTSGYIDDSLLQRGLEGRTHFIAKPFSVIDLTRKVREALDS